MNKVLILGLVWPEPNTTAAGGRMLQLIHYFLSQGYHVTFASTASVSEFSMDLRKLGVQCTATQLNDKAFDVFIKSLNPFLVLFDRFLTEEQFGWRVAAHTPQAIRILDTEDLHSLRAARQQSNNSGISFTLDSWRQHDKTKREIASIYRCDCSLIISTYEVQLLQEVIGVNPQLLLYFPFLLDSMNEYEKAKWPSFETRTDFIFIGSGKHDPNVDAIQWLKVELWPLIRQSLPTVNLRIYGSYFPHFIRYMHCPKDGFHIMGWTPNPKEVLSGAKVNLAPLRFGAGLKGKLIEGMQCGTPNVATSIGAEGMHGDLQWNGFIEDQPKQFSEKAVLLYSDSQQWKSSQDYGAAIINQCFIKEEHINSLKSMVKCLQDNLESHRNENFIGSMLHHHTMASTKYLSKWIELKNQ